MSITNSIAPNCCYTIYCMPSISMGPNPTLQNFGVTTGCNSNSDHVEDVPGQATPTVRCFQYDRAIVELALWLVVAVVGDVSRLLLLKISRSNVSGCWEAR